MADAAVILAAVSVLTSSGGMAVSTLIYRRLRLIDNVIALHRKYHPEDVELLQ
jgi:hypothetical protein